MEDKSDIIREIYGIKQDRIAAREEMRLQTELIIKDLGMYNMDMIEKPVTKRIPFRLRMKRSFNNFINKLSNMFSQ